MMLESLFYLLFWTADADGVAQSAPISTPTIATCSRPACMVIERRPACVIPAREHANSIDAQKLLRKWQQATQNFSERTRSVKEEFQQRIDAEFNRHARAAAESLLGPVNADQLAESFQWQILETTDQVVCLKAIPRDEVERLFYESLQIEINCQNGAPRQITIVGRAQRRQVVWRNPAAHFDYEIQLVRFENQVPPSPASSVRIAIGRAELQSIETEQK